MVYYTHLIFLMSPFLVSFADFLHLLKPIIMLLALLFFFYLYFKLAILSKLMALNTMYMAAIPKFIFLVQIIFP